MIFRVTVPLLLAAALSGQHSETTLTNPFRSADDRARGGAFFQSQCASCHGYDGKGGASGPNLTTGNFRHANSDEGLFRVITKGVPGTSMPGFSMNGREIWQIVAFVRGLSIGRTDGAARGDAATGAALYQANQCERCHILQGKGAPLGLDLSAIGNRLSAAELKLALTDPSAEVAAEYWAWQGTTKSGTVVRGSRLNEDTFSVQLLDSSGKLRSVLKSDLRSQSLDKRSPMPSWKDKLNDRQLDDLVAFLASRKGVSK